MVLVVAVAVAVVVVVVAALAAVVVAIAAVMSVMFEIVPLVVVVTLSLSSPSSLLCAPIHGLQRASRKGSRTSNVRLSCSEREHHTCLLGSAARAANIHCFFRVYGAFGRVLGRPMKTAATDDELKPTKKSG